MVCPNCSYDVASNDRFCAECGTKLTAVTPAAAVGACSVTGNPCQADDEGFCKDCGKRIHALSTRTSKARALRSHCEDSVGEHLALVCDIGQKHKINEDAGCIAVRADAAAILVVADGVSSSWNAQAASMAAVKLISDALLALPQDADPEEGLRRAIFQANVTVKALPNKSPDSAQDGPETTVVAALQRADGWIIGWVGDSRAYLLTAEGQTQLTRDDSWIEDVVDAGVMSREAANQDPLAHAVTQTLGMQGEEPIIHILRVSLPSTPWLLLLCTDGLWNYFEEPNALAKACAPYLQSGQALTLCHDLVVTVNTLGGRDNVTVGAFIQA